MMPLLIMKSNSKLPPRLILKIIFTSTSMPLTMTKDCNALVIATMTRMIIHLNFLLDSLDPKIDIMTSALSPSASH